MQVESNNQTREEESHPTDSDALLADLLGLTPTEAAHDPYLAQQQLQQAWAEVQTFWQAITSEDGRQLPTARQQMHHLQTILAKHQAATPTQREELLALPDTLHQSWQELRAAWREAVGEGLD